MSGRKEIGLIERPGRTSVLLEIHAPRQDSASVSNNRTDHSGLDRIASPALAGQPDLERDFRACVVVEPLHAFAAA